MYRLPPEEFSKPVHPRVALPCEMENNLAVYMFDNFNFVRHNWWMIINVRTFLRDFAACKTKARQGETVRIKDKDGEFLFTSAITRKTLLGCARGKIAIHDDLTKPTLSEKDWKPSL